jgi:hypothetical protein
LKLINDDPEVCHDPARFISHNSFTELSLHVQVHVKTILAPLVAYYVPNGIGWAALGTGTRYFNPVGMH